MKTVFYILAAVCLFSITSCLKEERTFLTFRLDTTDYDFGRSARLEYRDGGRTIFGFGVSDVYLSGQNPGNAHDSFVVYRTYANGIYLRLDGNVYTAFGDSVVFTNSSEKAGFESGAFSSPLYPADPDDPVRHISGSFNVPR